MTAPPFWDSPDQESEAEGSGGLWDTLVLDGEALPGLATVTGARGRKLDTKSPAGSDGGRIVDKGRKLAQIEVTLRMWLQAHWDVWYERSRDLTARSGQGRQRVAMSIAHPALSAVRIDRVYLEEVGILEDGSPKGVRQVKLKFVEYAPASRRNNVTRAASTTQVTAATDRPNTLIQPPSATNTGPRR